MKRIIRALTGLVLALCLFLSLAVPALAAETDPEARLAAETLYRLGLFRGKGLDAAGKPLFALDDEPTRHEAVTMLVRLLGKEPEAFLGRWENGFTDLADWAAPYVGCAYAAGLVQGTNREGTLFGGGSPVDANQYLTMVLRALGYSSETDFKWNEACAFADALGITDGRYTAGQERFTRGDVALISLRALTAIKKGAGETLLSAIQGGSPVMTVPALVKVTAIENGEMTTDLLTARAEGRTAVSDLAARDGGDGVSGAAAISYDWLGYVTRLTSADGSVVEYVRDGLGRALVTRTTLPGGASTLAADTYDGQGRVLNETNLAWGPDGALLMGSKNVYTYDADGHLTALAVYDLAGALLGSAAGSYDAGTRSSALTAEGMSLRAFYDEQGRVIRLESEAGESREVREWSYGTTDRENELTLSLFARRDGDWSLWQKTVTAGDGRPLLSAAYAEDGSLRSRVEYTYENIGL